MSTVLASFMLFSTTAPTFAMTGKTAVNTGKSGEKIINNILNQGKQLQNSTEKGSNSNFEQNQAEQLQNLYLQKLKFDPKILETSKQLDLIVQFDVDPAQIQKVNQEKNDSTDGVKAFSITQESTSDVTLESAEKAVNQTHSNFKSFITNETKALKDSAGTNSIKLGREYTQVFNGLAVKIPSNALNDMLALPYVKSAYLNVKYAPIVASQKVEVSSSITGDGKVSAKQTNPNLVPAIRSNRGKEESTSGTSYSPAKSGDSIKPLTVPVTTPGPEGSQSGETAVLDWMKIHDLQNENITGNGVKVGVIDTGLDYNHPDIAGEYQGGKDFVDNDNDPMETVYTDWLAAKKANDALPPEQQDQSFPTDYHDYITSHGTHVAGTIAGQSRNNSPYALRGVAPEVQLYAYRVLGPYGGSDEAVLAGIDQSYRDGCKVINLSLGMELNDSLSANAVAINNVTDLGVTAVIAAGNSGPNAGTVGTPGAAAKAITVGAITYPQQIPTFNIHSYGGTEQESYAITNTRLLGRDFTESTTKLSGSTKYDLVDAGSGTPAWYDYLRNKNISIVDKVVLVKRGAASVNQLMAYAAEEHVKAMILWNPSDNPDLLVDDQGYYPFYIGTLGDSVYTLQLNMHDGTNFYNAFKSGTIKNISLSNAGNYIMGGNTLASFSSTGPVTGSLAIKPDVVAPGVDVFSSAPYDIWEPDNKDYSNAYQTMSGTSMATPHVAGMAALILAAHPNYKPEDVKAALMETADPISTQQSLFQIGSGKTDPYQAVHTDMLFKVKDFIQSRSSTDTSSTSNIISEENTTSSFSFGYTARQEDGTVLKTGDLYITNNGTSAKTFNTNSVFFKDTYLKTGQDGEKEGAKISLSNATSPATELTSISVPAGGTVHLIAKFTTPASAASGFYEAYINFANSASSTETYRIPLAIDIQSRGIEFSVERKAFTLNGDKNFNPNTFAVAPIAYAGVRVKSPIDPSYGLRLYVMDITGSNYIGFISSYSAYSFNLGDLQQLPFMMNGYYYPYSAPISKDDPNLTTKLTQQMSSTKVADEGGYVIQARAIDASSGKLYQLNSTVYVDNTAPTVKMDTGSEPGIYEIDTNGPVTDGGLKWFSGKAYDSNVDYMKNVGHETAVPKPPVYDTDTNVSQSLGKIDGMLGDSNDDPYVNYFLNMNGDGTFKFGISKDDLVNSDTDPYKENYGTQFRIYPEDYSYAGNLETQGQFYYFVKKGNEYVVNRFARLDTPGSTTLNGVDPAFLVNKTLVSKGDNFKSTLSIKYPKNVVGAKFYIDELPFADITNIDFSPQYKAFLASKGITADKSWIHKSYDINGDFIFNFNLPEGVQSQGVLNSSDTMSGGIAQEMPILDISYKVTNDAGYDTLYLVGSALIPEITTYSGGKTEMDRVPTFLDKQLYIKGAANISGSIKPEGFQSYPTSNIYGRSTPITNTGSGVDIRFEDPNTGGITSVLPIAPDPSVGASSINPGINQVGLFTTDLPMQAGTKPYNFTMKMPGHFTYHGTLDVNSKGQYNYAAGGNYAVPNFIMLAGDVNGDDVIDMRDIEAESTAYNAYVATSSTYTRAADLNYDGVIDYNDFGYIIKNFGKYNTTASNAETLAGNIVSTTSAEIKLTGFNTIPKGSDLTAFNTVVKPVPYIKTSDANAFVNYGKVNPFQLFSVVYKTPDIVTGASTITQIEDTDYRAAIDGAGGQILIDGVDRKAATNVYNGVSQNSIIEKVVNNKGQYEFDPSLFKKSGVHTIVFKAPGYMDRSMKFKMQDGVGNSFIPIAPNNSPTVGKALTYSRADGTGSTAAHYRDIWQPNITSITVTDPNNNVVATYKGNELAALFNQVTPTNATTFNFTIPAGVFSTPSLTVGTSIYDWNISVAADNFTTYSFAQRISAFPGPALTAESNRYFNDSNSNPISIAVGATNDTQAWRDAITAVQVGSTTISKADFASKNITIGTPGTPIQIDKSQFTAPGSITINVIATNYQTATVNQPLYKQGIALTSPSGTIFAGKDLVMTYTPSTAAADWISALKTSGNIKFGGNSIKTRVVIDETAGTIKIPYDLVRTDGGAAVSRDFIASVPGYADNRVSVTVTPQTAPAITLSAPTGTPQFGDTITYTINGDDNPLWRSSILLATTSDLTIDNGDVTIQFTSATSVKPFITTSVINGTGAVTIDGYATQSNTDPGNKNIKFKSPYFTPITIAQPFNQRKAPTLPVTPSGVGKPVVITIQNNAENMRWATAAKAASGDITVGGVSIKADTTISSNDSDIILTIPGTAFPATGNYEIKFNAYCYPETKITQVVKNNAPKFASKIAYIQETKPITTSYAPDSAWLASTPVVSINGKLVDSSKFKLSATELTFVDRSLFPELGDYKVTISAPGYIDTKFDIFVSDELQHLITATTDSNGSIDPSGSVPVDHGKDQTFTITPNKGYEIATFKVDGKDVTVSNNTYTLTNITSNHTIDVKFKLIVHTITATADDHGTISPSGKVTVIEESDQTFTITPERGYEIATMKVDGVAVSSTNNTYKFTNVTSDHTINVSFKQILHTIMVTAGDHGTISPSGRVTVNELTDQMFMITPDIGYEIATLKVDNVETMATNNIYTLTNIKGNHTIDVTFKKIVHTITATAGSNGTISPSGSVPVKHGEDQTFTITPKKGYEIASFVVDGVNAKLTKNTYTFSSVTKNHTINVSFKQILHTITVTAGKNGTISPIGKVSVADGTNKKFTIIPKKGYMIDTIKVDGVNVKFTGNTYTLTNVTKNRTINVTFKQNVHTITVTVGKNGTISPGGKVTVADGTNKTFKITAKKGYIIATLKVDGVNVKLKYNAYTFTNITKNHTIYVTFKRK
ncbi:S8 family serine peptidase [Bacillus sp. AFS017336]|uniref:S8 family serine peptidase n=1 Tax=Bacillus sp. AFS017336 TaxID=2033489 RepID=UPI0015CF1A29|nr:S8 family serine peptidase [Bacillus sp. AFS017336]